MMTGLTGQIWKVLLWVMGATVLLYRPMQAAVPSHFRMTGNLPFEARAAGLVGSLGVEIGEEQRYEEINRRLRAALARSRSASSLRSRQRLEQFLLRVHRLKPGQRLKYDRRVVLTRNGQPILPIRQSQARAAFRFGNGAMTINFADWSAEDEAQLRGFVNVVMPHIEAVYGKPATSITVTIRQDPGMDAIDGGLYNVTTKEILIPPLRNFQDDSFKLTHLIMHAFHDELQFSFDAWEEGFSRAAALFAYLRVDSSFDPVRDDPFYLQPFYDCLNQPALGSGTFSPSSGYEGMIPWRLGMAQAAWLKVATENASFFRDFNNAYYTRFPEENLEGNTPALKQIAQSIVPVVEGLGFTDWYRRQFILDTSNSLGKKLYVFNLPQFMSVVLIPEHFTSDASGNETPLTTQGDLTYRNDESDDLFAEEGNTVAIENGEGFISPQFFNLGGANRMFVDVRASGLLATLLFPYNVVHESPQGDADNLFGAVVGSDTGSLKAGNATRALPESASMTRGVFAFPPDIPMNGLSRLSFDYTATDTGQTVSVDRNTGFGYYVVLFQSPVSVSTLTHGYSKGTTGYQMVSLPGRPLNGDEAAVFGISPTRFLMARWRPEVPGDSKYELYPNLSTPLGPGLGAWVKLENNVNVSVQAEPVLNDSDFQMRLFPGFNQIGPPMQSTFSLSELFVQAPGGMPMDFNSAQAAGLVSSGVFEYSQTDGYRLATSLAPWVGYWVRVTNADGLDLMFPTAGRNRRSNAQPSPRRLSSSALRSSSPLPGSLGLDPRRMRRDNWSFRISVLSPVIKDLDNFLGVAPRATDSLDNVYDVVQPPEFGGYVSLYFPCSLGISDERLAADVRSPFSGKKEWDFLVTTNLGDTNLTLTWGDLKALPRALRFRLTDLDTGGSLNMRRQTSYAYRTGANPARRFRITVATGSQLPVRFSNPSMARTPRGYALSFNASEPVDAMVEVFSVRGRKLSTLRAVPSSANGDYTLQWDLKDTAGRRV
ncbi:MAG: hypothetical protein HY318_13220, partial [Armatimonadetes bacterium]|nr:hypothetical protein [Armatimonadota bacterium]